MLVIGVTEKLKKKLKITIEESELTKKNNIYCWHANYLIWQRKACILITNNRTRYSVVLYGIKASEMSNFKNIFIDQLKRNLINDGSNEEIVNKYINDLESGKIIFTKTSDRSILGTMNDFIMIMSYDIEDYINNRVVHIDEYNRRVNNYVTLSLKKVDLPAYPNKAMLIELNKKYKSS